MYSGLYMLFDAVRGNVYCLKKNRFYQTAKLFVSVSVYFAIDSRLAQRHATHK